MNMYKSNRRVPKYIKQPLRELKGDRGNKTIIVGIFNTPFSIREHRDRKSIR